MFYIPPVYVVSIDADRLAQFKRAWSAVGLPPDAVHEWNGLRLRMGEGSLGNAISQYALVRHALASGLDSILVFEDDAVPCDDAAAALPEEIEAARARGDSALRLGWLPNNDADDDPSDGAVLFGSHAYALLSRRAMSDYCEAWSRNGRADYIFGVMMGRVSRASKCLFLQHVPSGKRGIHLPEGWQRVIGMKALRSEHAAFVKAAAAIGADPPEFSGT